MSVFEENVFGAENPTELIIRWSDNDIKDFKTKNHKSFENIKSELTNSERICVFIKSDKNTFKIYVPLFEGQFEMFVEWDDISFSFNIVNDKKKYPVYKDQLSLPTDKIYIYEKKCRFVFIGQKDSKRSKDELIDLYEEISKLQIMPKPINEKERDIWDKWIEAQAMLIELNSKPFNVSSYFPISENRNISEKNKYVKFKVGLLVEENKELKDLEAELAQALNIHAVFNSDGFIELNPEDLFGGLDLVISKKFSALVEREKNVLAVIDISPNNILNVTTTASFVDDLKRKDKTDSKRVRESFENETRKQVYNLDPDIAIDFNKNKLFIRIESEDEIREKFDALKLIGSLGLNEYTEIKCKVKVSIIKAKTDKELLLDRIKELDNEEFRIAVNKEKKEYISIGNLKAAYSDDKMLIFYIKHNTESEINSLSKLMTYLSGEDVIKQIEPNLTGDIAKIKWLREAISKVNSPSGTINGKPVNIRLGEYIFDSSKAEGIFKDISYNSEEWTRVKQNALLKLNDSQLKAVLTAIHANDLCLLQGPPGTGKTTVIAELIWQLITLSQAGRILLTSETNLAVDNAIEKLINKEHTLVKPLRIGRSARFEEEGRKYAIDRILKWIDDKYEVSEYEESSLDAKEGTVDSKPENNYNNAVQLWMNRIADKSVTASDSKYSDVLTEWSQDLKQPTKSTKELFKNKYFENVNVFGCTCSSTGSPSFKRNFHEVFNAKTDYISENEKIARLPVEFDTVIMDEASKATPPEMLLPLCFGRKSVVIGDHKQLPPMLNEKEFREALLELKNEKAILLANEIDNEFISTSQFEKLIMNPKIDSTIVSRLNIQYRMHPKINNVIRQFYTSESDEGLEPAPEIISNCDAVDLSNPFSRYHGFRNEGFINPDVHTIWVNVNEPEEKIGTSRMNIKEVEVVRTVLQYLKKSRGFEEYMSHWSRIKNKNKRIEEAEIGLISFYGHQVAMLKDIKKYAQTELKIPVRLNTVDKFQGMERNIIIVSTVRSNKLLKDDGSVCKNSDIGFAKAPERLNVALSRARRLLIVVGNLDFFEAYKDSKGNAIYKNVIDMIRQEGLIIADYKMLNM